MVVRCARVREGDAFGVSERTSRAAGGEGSRASLCKGDGQFGNPGIPMATEVVAFRTSCGIVSARLSANNGRARAGRASKSDGCSALLKRIRRVRQARRLRPAIQTEPEVVQAAAPSNLKANSDKCAGGPQGLLRA